MANNKLYLNKRYQFPDVIGKIAEKHGVSRDQISRQLLAGIKIEYEHKKDNVVARQIALDHLEEVPDYYDKLKKVEENNDGFREKAIGPLKFVYQGATHIGNVIAPTLGGDHNTAQKYTAISKLWGKKSTHDSKHSALEWLKNRHGASMKIESAFTEEMETSTTQDILRQHGWKKAQPYGFNHHLTQRDNPVYVHSDLPGHRITVSYHDNLWSHRPDPRSTTGIASAGIAKLHRYLQKLHGNKQEETLKDFVAFVQEEHPINWKEQITQFLEEKIVERTPYHKHEILHVKKGKNITYQSKIHKDGKYVITNHQNYDDAVNHIDKHQESLKEEPYEGGVQGATPHSNMQRSVKRSKISIVKKDPNNLVGSLGTNSVQENIKQITLDSIAKLHGLKKENLLSDPKNKINAYTHKELPYQTIKTQMHINGPRWNHTVTSGGEKRNIKSGSDLESFHNHLNQFLGQNKSLSEELYDWEKNRKDPNAGPKDPVKQSSKDIKSKNDDKQGPKPKPSENAETELTLKRTMTGEPGPTIEINPVIRNLPGNQGSNYAPSSDHKKSPQT